MDGGAWWAAVYGVAQSWTRLKRLSSSSHLTLPGCGKLLLLSSRLWEAAAALSDPMDCSLPGSSRHGIFPARVLEWGAIITKS